MELKTIADILDNLQRHHRKGDLLRFKRDGAWVDISTDEFVRTVRHLAQGLAEAGVGRGDRVAILAENRPEWTAFDHAALNLGAVIVPIYTTLMPDQIRFILDNSQSRLLVVSNAGHLDRLMPVRDRLPALTCIVVIDPPGTIPEGVTTWSSLLASGEAADRSQPGRFEESRSRITPDDLASIIYTSGTTGEPKGVMLTHSNFASNVSATMRVVPFYSSDVALSFLPLSHVFERINQFNYLSCGGTIAFAESIDKVPQNMAEIRPTVVASVPRLFEKMHTRILDAVRASSPVRRLIFAAALALGRRHARAMLAGRPASWLVRLLHPLADRLVFARVRDRLGGRIRFFISGGAPLAAEINEFLHAAGLRVLEGYGLTETSPVIAINTLDCTRIGTVGPVIPGVEVRIADDGEILARGPNIMRGYFRNEQATLEAIRDGWFHTGDIGHIDDDGCLKITDRKKDVLKTSGGKMIAPQPIENLLKTDRFISQAVLIGDRRKFVSALIAPDREWLESYARRKGIEYTTVDELIRHPKVIDLFRRRIEGKMDGLARYERIKAFRLLPRELSLEEDELTPTLKVKRRVIERRYADLIDSIYRD